MATIFKEEPEEEYSTQSDSEDIIVTTTTGDGQPNKGISVFLGSTLKGNGENVNIGSASNAKGKKVLVVVAIKDMLDETNWVSFTTTFEEGSEETVYGPYSEEAPQDKDTIIFTLPIKIN